MIRIHHCVGQINVAEERSEPPAPKCKCRKFITLDQATQMVKNREASWVVTKRTRGYAEVTCTMCGGDKAVTTCAKCGGKGYTIDNVVWNEYNNDVVLVSAMPEDSKERKRSSVLKKMTPRVATIEQGHIERAYVYGNKDAEARIDEYGMLILKEQLRLLAVDVTREQFEEAWKEYEAGKCISKGGLPVPARMEPDDKAELGQGRRFDYGRTI